MKGISFSGITANLMVGSVDDTVAFYRDVLGFEAGLTVPPSGPLVWAKMEREGAAIMFQERKNLIGEYPVLGSRHPAGALTLFVQISGLDAFYASVEGRAKIAKALHTTFYGMKEFAIEDNNGFVLTFAEPAA